MPEEWGGMGLGPRRAGHGAGRVGPRLLRPVGAQLPGARRGQHAHAAALGHRRAEGEVPPPALRGHDLVVLRHDRTRGGRQRPHADPDAGLRGRRRVGHQRPQVVHLQRPPGELRHPHRPHRGRSRPAAGRQHRVHRRHPAGRLERGPPDRDHARLDRPLRDRHRGSAGPQGPDAGRPGPGPPAGPVPPGPGPAGALHALDRPGRDGAGHDGGPVARTGSPTARSWPRSRGSSG